MTATARQVAQMAAHEAFIPIVQGRGQDQRSMSLQEFHRWWSRDALMRRVLRKFSLKEEEEEGLCAEEHWIHTDYDGKAIQAMEKAKETEREKAEEVARKKTTAAGKTKSGLHHGVPSSHPDP